MSAWDILRAIVAAVVFGLFLNGCFAAKAEEQPSKSEWYRSLRQPGTGASCCDVSDCAPAKATFRAGRWWVITGDRELIVPPDLILDREPYDGISAYACIVGGRVYCFIRPGSGG